MNDYFCFKHESANSRNNLFFRGNQCKEIKLRNEKEGVEQKLFMKNKIIWLERKLKSIEDKKKQKIFGGFGEVKCGQRCQKQERKLRK